MMFKALFQNEAWCWKFFAHAPPTVAIVKEAVARPQWSIKKRSRNSNPFHHSSVAEV